MKFYKGLRVVKSSDGGVGVGVSSFGISGYGPPNVFGGFISGKSQTREFDVKDILERVSFILTRVYVRE